jgi:hypothetical protein
MDQITARRSNTVQLGLSTFTDTAGRTSTNQPRDRNIPELAEKCSTTYIIFKIISQFGEDAKDAEWLAHLLACGLLRGSFIAPAQIAAIRDLTRYRKKLIASRGSEVQRLGKVLEDGIKIDSVASSRTTASARHMVEALIAGQPGPKVLAQLAMSRMRGKIPGLEQACVGRFGQQHALLARLHPERIDHPSAMIDELDHRIEAMSVPFAVQIKPLTTIPGSVSAPHKCSSQRSGWTFPGSPPRRTWPPGPGYARATTNPPGRRISAGPATATGKSVTCSPNAPGPRDAPAPTSAPATGACTAASANRAAAKPPSRSLTP